MKTMGTINRTHTIILMILVSSLFCSTSLCMNKNASENGQDAIHQFIRVLGPKKGSDWMAKMLMMSTEDPVRVLGMLYKEYSKHVKKSQQKQEKKRDESFVGSRQQSRGNQSELSYRDKYGAQRTPGERSRSYTSKTPPTSETDWEFEASFCLEVAREVERLEKPTKPTKVLVLESSDSDDDEMSDQEGHIEAMHCRLKEIEAYAAVAILMGAKTSVFFLAVTWGDCAVVRYLLEAASKPEKLVAGKDDAGFTPLHWAAAVRRADMVQLLLNCGADKTVVDNKGRTPAEIVRSWGYNDIITLLA